MEKITPPFHHKLVAFFTMGRWFAESVSEVISVYGSERRKTMVTEQGRQTIQKV